jgi:hypothetical protein
VSCWKNVQRRLDHRQNNNWGCDVRDPTRRVREEEERFARGGGKSSEQEGERKRTNEKNERTYHIERNHPKNIKANITNFAVFGTRFITIIAYCSSWE